MTLIVWHFREWGMGEKGGFSLVFRPQDSSKVWALLETEFRG